MNKLLQFKRSYLYKGYKYLKDMHEGALKRRIEGASTYTGRPVCPKCSGEVVKLKYRFTLGVDLFNVICRSCGHSWFTIKDNQKPKISKSIAKQAEYMRLPVEDFLYIEGLKQKALARVEERREKEEEARKIRCGILRLSTHLLESRISEGKI
jgi:hypothetical protein